MTRHPRYERPATARSEAVDISVTLLRVNTAPAVTLLPATLDADAATLLPATLDADAPRHAGPTWSNTPLANLRLP